MSVMLITVSVIDSWLRGSAHLRDLTIIRRRSHASGRGKTREEKSPLSNKIRDDFRSLCKSHRVTPRDMASGRGPKPRVKACCPVCIFLPSFFLSFYLSFFLYHFSLSVFLTLITFSNFSFCFSFFSLSFFFFCYSLITFPLFLSTFFSVSHVFLLSFFLSFYLSFSFYPSFFTISLSQYV